MENVIFYGYIIVMILGFVFNMPTFLLSFLVAFFVLAVITGIREGASKDDVTDSVDKLKEYNYNYLLKPYAEKFEEQAIALNSKIDAMHKISAVDFISSPETFNETLKIAQNIMESNLQSAYKRFVYINTEKDIDDRSKAFLEKILEKNRELLEAMNSLLVSLTEINSNDNKDVLKIEDLSEAIKKLYVEEE